MSLRRRAGLAIALAALAAPAGAATFVVNSPADTTDATCGAGAGECTLREAIEAAVAAPGRDTIRFDPGVFPPGTLTPINLATPLPVVADAAGTVVDGSGSSVSLVGSPAVANGLVFASAPGVALEDVEVVRLRLTAFFGDALHVCGGVPPLCDGDVSSASVRQVTAADNAGNGILIQGALVSKARVVDSVVQLAGAVGIRISGLRLVDARVAGCTARDNAFAGIQLDGGFHNERPSVADSAAYSNGGGGISVSGHVVSKAKLTNLVASSNGDDGIYVFAEESAASTSIASVLASANLGSGVNVVTAFGNTATSLREVVADSNQPHGVSLEGQVARPKLERVGVFHNGDGGIALLSETHKARLREVVAVGNNEGIYLKGTQGKLDRILAAANGDVGIFLLDDNDRTTVRRSTSLDNNTGIFLRGPATRNRILGNVALGNQNLDLHDEDGCGTDLWRKNAFRTAGDPCIR